MSKMYVMIFSMIAFYSNIDYAMDTDKTLKPYANIEILPDEAISIIASHVVEPSLDKTLMNLMKLASTSKRLRKIALDPYTIHNLMINHQISQGNAPVNRWLFNAIQTGHPLLYKLLPSILNNTFIFGRKDNIPDKIMNCDLVIARKPLMIAAELGNLNVVQKILSFPALHINQQEPLNGQTALILAATQGNNEVVKTLLEAGADATIQDSFGNTAATYEARKKNMH